MANGCWHVLARLSHWSAALLSLSDTRVNVSALLYLVGLAGGCNSIAAHCKYNALDNEQCKVGFIKSNYRSTMRWN